MNDIQTIPENLAGDVPAQPILPETIGKPADVIKVELSTRFLEHFSEQLYSSPQKAFEELISNAWDAGADRVDVHISDDLSLPSATMCVLDNGTSMDAEGLRRLWHIAFSPKRDNPVHKGRHVIGKFGIGKLATYVLANKLTYICKGSDGVIRRVTMDYSHIDEQQGAEPDKLINDLKLEVFDVDPEDLKNALSAIECGPSILQVIDDNFPEPEKGSFEDEFGGVSANLEPPSNDTWTIVILSDLKPAGRALRVGVLRRMLEAALPFGSEMAISLNGSRLSSSKVDASLLKEWVIGPDLGLSEIELKGAEDEGNPSDTASAEAPEAQQATGQSGGDAAPQKITITSGNDPYPFIEIPGIGRVTGRVRLFNDKISVGKSEERGASNGFHVNVLGRVVNQGDPSFGEENLSHAAWARFRMTVRADGLNRFLTTNREQFKEEPELKVFRAFLRRVFNITRAAYDADKNTEIPDGGDVLVKSLGVLSLSPLRNVVSDTLASKAPVRGLFNDADVNDRNAKRLSWRENTSENIRNALKQVKYERLEDDKEFVQFKISDSSIVVNKEHPFVLEHSRTRAEKELIRTVAMINLLTDVYALDAGVDPDLLQNIRNYRDRLMRYKALERRTSGQHIAKLLLQTQHESSESKKLEKVVSDALRYLGFSVKDLAKSGEPEGIASAYPYPTRRVRTDDERIPPLYSFTFDAKSSKHEAAKTGNIGLDGIAEHRDRYAADHALVVAPGYTGDAIVTRCEQLKVTAMTAHDLGRLMEYTVEYGAIPLTKFRDVLYIYNHEKVTEWVTALGEEMSKSRKITYHIFLSALEKLKGKVPDALPAEIIAFTCREQLNVVSATADEILAIARGLEILVPDLVGIEGDKIVVNASPEKVADAVHVQLELLHNVDQASDTSVQ